MYSVRFWSVQSIQQKVVIMELTQFSMGSLDGRSMRWKWRRWVWSTEEHVVEKNRVNEWSELCLERRFNASYFEEYPISLPDPPRNCRVLIFVKTGLEHISVVLPVRNEWMTADKIKWSRLCFADISEIYFRLSLMIWRWCSNWIKSFGEWDSLLFLSESWWSLSSSSWPEPPQLVSPDLPRPRHETKVSWGEI